MKDPTGVMVELLGVEDSETFFMGRMAMALEVVGVIRVIEGFPDFMAPLDRAVAVNVLRTFLRDQDLTVADEVYDQLSALRRPVFVPEPLLEHSVEPSDAPDPQDRSDGSSSLDASLAGVDSRTARLRALLDSRRGRGTETIDGLEESSASASSELSSDESRLTSDPTESEDSPEQTQL